jgi:hypothetical protein
MIMTRPWIDDLAERRTGFVREPVSKVLKRGVAIEILKRHDGDDDRVRVSPGSKPPSHQTCRRDDRLLA